MASLSKDAARLARVSEHVITASIAVGDGVLSFFLMLFVFSWGVAFLAGMGISLCLARELFFYLIPTLIDYAVPAVFVLNRAIDGADIFFFAVAMAFDTISAALSAFHLNLGTMSPLNIKEITVQEYVSSLKFVASECAPYTTAVFVWEKAAVPEINDAVCPYVRMLYPVWGDFLDKYVDGVLITNADPYSNSCHVEHVPAATTAVCTSLATGYIVLEVLVPLLLIGLFVWTALGSLRHLAFEIMNIAYVAVSVMTDKSVSALKFVDDFFFVVF